MHLKLESKQVDTVPVLSAITFLGTGSIRKFHPEESSAIPVDMMTSFSEVKAERTFKHNDLTANWIDHNR